VNNLLKDLNFCHFHDGSGDESDHIIKEVLSGLPSNITSDDQLILTCRTEKLDRSAGRSSCSNETIIIDPEISGGSNFTLTWEVPSNYRILLLSNIIQVSQFLSLGFFLFDSPLEALASAVTLLMEAEEHIRIYTDLALAASLLSILEEQFVGLTLEDSDNYWGYSIWFGYHYHFSGTYWVLT